MARWCRGCAGHLGATATACSRFSRRYYNVNGVFNVDGTWSYELQLTARWAWVSRLGATMEGAFWQNFVRDFLDWRGYSSIVQVREPGDVMFLLIMACVRWPAVVYQAMGALDGFEPRSGSPAGWHLYLVRLLRLADGHEWREMFSEISQGRCGFEPRLRGGQARCVAEGLRCSRILAELSAPQGVVRGCASIRRFLLSCCSGFEPRCLHALSSCLGARELDRGRALVLGAGVLHSRASGVVGEGARRGGLGRDVDDSCHKRWVHTAGPGTSAKTR